MKPLIGITSNYIYSYLPKLAEGGPDEKSQLDIIKSTYIGERLFCFNDMPFVMSLATDIRAIELTGGIPVVIPQLHDDNLLKDLIDKLDGIVFAGGSDIHPKFYNENSLEFNKGLFGTIDNLDDKDASVFSKAVVERDEMELKLMNMVLDNSDMPVLGICRGLQVMNVARGGGLYPDLASHYIEDFLIDHSDVASWNSHVHSINIEKRSLLNDIFDAEDICVNSIHHQAIKRVADGFRISAKSEDGIIEAIELEDSSRFVLGVQWHPEMLMATDENQMKIYTTFIDSAK